MTSSGMSSSKLVEEARSRIGRVSPQDALLLLSSEVCFVDIRDGQEIAESGTIPGAIHVPRGSLEFCLDADSRYHRPELTQDRPYIYFCSAGLRSSLAADLAARFGVADSRDLEGGFSAWEAAGLPKSP